MGPQLEDGRADFLLVAIAEVAGEISKEVFVQSVLKVLWLDPALELDVLGRAWVREEGVPGPCGDCRLWRLGGEDVLDTADVDAELASKNFECLVLVQVDVAAWGRQYVQSGCAGCDGDGQKRNSQRWAGQSGFDCGIGDVVRLLHDGPSTVVRTQELVEDGSARGVGCLLRSDVRPHRPGREPVLQSVSHR